jgi:MFS family permease
MSPASGARLAEFLGLKRNIVVLLISIVVIGTGEELWKFFVPKYLQVLGAGVFIIGFCDALTTFLGAVYAFPGGVLTDKIGHRRSLIVFNLISLAGYALVLLVPHWSAVVGGTFLFVGWSAFSLPATFSLVGATLHESKHAMGIGIQSIIKRLPIIVGPYLGGLLVAKFGWIDGVRWALGVSILLGIVAIFVQQRMIEPENRAENHRFRHGLWQIFRNFSPDLRRLLLSDILIRFCERVPFAFVVLYATDFVRLSAPQAGLLKSVEVITAIVCCLPVAYLADKYGREPFVIATFIFFTLFPVTLLWADNFAWMIFAFAVRGLKEFGEPARKALIIGYAPAKTRARTVGAYYLIRDVIVTAGSFLGAALWKTSPEANFLGAAFLGALGTIVYVMTLRRFSWKNGREMAQ